MDSLSIDELEVKHKEFALKVKKQDKIKIKLNKPLYEVTPSKQNVHKIVYLSSRQVNSQKTLEEITGIFIGLKRGVTHYFYEPYIILSDGKSKTMYSFALRYLESYRIQK